MTKVLVTIFIFIAGISYCQIIDTVEVDNLKSLAIQRLYNLDSTEIFPGFYIFKEEIQNENCKFVNYDSITFQDTIKMDGVNFIYYKIQRVMETITKDYLQIVIYSSYRDIYYRKP